MGEVVGWLGALIEWLAAWVPRLVHIDVRERGVRFVRGMEPCLVEPGLCFSGP